MKLHDRCPLMSMQRLRDLSSLWAKEKGTPWTGDPSVTGPHAE